MPAPARPWLRSLRWRLLLATLVALLLALVLAGLLLAGLFRDHVMRQFQAGLVSQLDQVTARLEFDADGRPQLDASSLTDPRWSRPYGGLYWQVDALVMAPTEAPATQRGVLRSRSLWDSALVVDSDALPDGTVHVHQARGPDAAALLLVERSLRHGPAAPTDGPQGSSWRVLVAADLGETHAAVNRFNGMLGASLAGLFGLLCVAALAQVRIGLAPLRSLQRALAALREGEQQRLDGQFPDELQPLIDNFNAVLDRNAEVVARARTQAGNLAHAIKTPLAVLEQAASAAGRPGAATAMAELPPLVHDQVAAARRHVDWHLARSRAAAAQGLPGMRVAVAPVVAGLLRVMSRVHAARGLVLHSAPIDPTLGFAGEVQDLQEILGNVLDNACKWARKEVQVEACIDTDTTPPRLRISISDDGPGIGAEQRAAAMARGERLDEAVPGSGLGLAIVHELVGLYGGQIQLGSAATGGLQLHVWLPARAAAPVPMG